MSGDHNLYQTDYKKLYEDLKEQNKMRFEPPSEVMEAVVKYELGGRQNDDGWCAIFSTDKEEDIRQIKKMIKSLKRVLEFYGAFDEEI
jgi:HEPN domain-containing protein